MKRKGERGRARWRKLTDWLASPVGVHCVSSMCIDMEQAPVSVQDIEHTEDEIRVRKGRK